MLGVLRETMARVLPASVVEYVYVTDTIRYPLGFCTQEEAVVAGVNLYTRQHFPDDSGPFRHAFGIHRSDCERVESSQNTSIPCNADNPDGYCWEGVVEVQR